MVNFMCLPDWPRGAQIHHCFYVCHCGCFWRILASESEDSVDFPPQCGWTSPNVLRAWIEQKVEEGGILPFSFLLESGILISSPLDLGLGVTTLAPLVPRPSNLEWTAPPAFLDLQLGDGRSGTCQPPCLCEPILHNNSIYLSIYMYICRYTCIHIGYICTCIRHICIHRGFIHTYIVCVYTYHI